MHKSAKLRPAVRNAEAALIQLNRGVETTDTDVLDTNVTFVSSTLSGTYQVDYCTCRHAEHVNAQA